MIVQRRGAEVFNAVVQRTISIELQVQEQCDVFYSGSRSQNTPADAEFPEWLTDTCRCSLLPSPIMVGPGSKCIAIIFGIVWISLSY